MSALITILSLAVTLPWATRPPEGFSALTPHFQAYYTQKEAQSDEEEDRDKLRIVPRHGHVGRYEVSLH